MYKYYVIFRGGTPTGSPAALTAAKAIPGNSSPPSLPSRPGPGHPLYHYVIEGPHGIALFDYNALQIDELSFKVLLFQFGTFSLINSQTNFVEDLASKT